VGGLPEEFQSDKKANNVKKKKSWESPSALKSPKSVYFLFLTVTETAPKVKLFSFSNASQQKLIKTFGFC
jgi:hypothetical protein